MERTNDARTLLQRVSAVYTQFPNSENKSFYRLSRGSAAF